MKNFWDSKKVLVTGHTGFKGSWLSFWLKLLGAEVCGFSLPPNATPNLFDDLNLKNEIHSVFGDVRDLSLLNNTVREFKPEIVFHLAAQSLVRKSYRSPVDTYTTNVIGTVNILESIRLVDFVKAAVIVTTDKVYENKEWHWAYRENERLGGFDPYSNSKACAELAVSAYRNSFFGDSQALVATARAGNVIGGGDWSEDRLLPDVFRSLIFNKELVIRSPHSVRPWQHVLESLSGYKILAEKLYEGKKAFADSWNFGPSESETKPVNWVLDEIKRIWNDPIKWTFAESVSLHEATLLKIDSAKAKSELDWSSKLSLKEAISLTAEWYKGFKNNDNLIKLTGDQIAFYNNKKCN